MERRSGMRGKSSMRKREEKGERGWERGQEREAEEKGRWGGGAKRKKGKRN